MSLIEDTHPTGASDAEDPSSFCFSCPLCCEEKPSSQICVLSACGHKSCRECCVKWIEKAEASGQQGLPACPWCRATMTEEETQRFLGRPFNPKTVCQAAAYPDLDELTLQWLQEQTRPCPGCGAYIERVSGCDAMECLCGFRFCYQCGSPADECNCSEGRPYCFYDNITGHETDDDPAWVAQNTQGRVMDLGHCIRIRQQVAAGDSIRRQRTEQREETQQIMAWAGFNLSAPWLFCRTHQSTLKVLNQISRRDHVNVQRFEEKIERIQEKSNEIDLMMEEIEEMDEFTLNALWLSCPTRSSTIKVMNQIRQAATVREMREVELSQQFWERSHEINQMMMEIEELDQPTSSSTWLFRSQKSMFKVMDQVFQGPAIRTERLLIKEEKAREDSHQIDQMMAEIEQLDQPASCSPWLWCPNLKSSLKVMDQIFQKPAIRAIRSQKNEEKARTKSHEIDQMMREIEEMDELTLTVPWLSCPTIASTWRVMVQIHQAESVREMRELETNQRFWDKSHETNLMMMEIEELDQATACAPWLFCSKLESTLRVMDQVCQGPARRARRSQRKKEIANQMVTEEEETDEPTSNRSQPLSSAPQELWYVTENTQYELLCRKMLCYSMAALLAALFWWQRIALQASGINRCPTSPWPPAITQIEAVLPTPAPNNSGLPDIPAVVAEDQEQPTPEPNTRELPNKTAIPAVVAEEHACDMEFEKCVMTRDCCGTLECVLGDWAVTTDSHCLSRRSATMNALTKDQKMWMLEDFYLNKAPPESRKATAKVHQLLERHSRMFAQLVQRIEKRYQVELSMPN